MKPLIWPIAVSSIFLLGQTAFAETSEPAQTEPSTTISSSGAENGASETEMTSMYRQIIQEKRFHLQKIHQ